MSEASRSTSNTPTSGHSSNPTPTSQPTHDIPSATTPLSCHPGLNPPNLPPQLFQQLVAQQNFENMPDFSCMPLAVPMSSVETKEEVKKEVDDLSGPHICTSCGITSTPLWRKNEKGDFECNACNLYFRKNQCPRPSNLAQKVSKRRKRSFGSGNNLPDVKKDHVDHLLDHTHARDGSKDPHETKKKPRKSLQNTPYNPVHGADPFLKPEAMPQTQKITGIPPELAAQFMAQAQMAQMASLAQFWPFPQSFGIPAGPTMGLQPFLPPSTITAGGFWPMNPFLPPMTGLFAPQTAPPLPKIDPAYIQALFPHTLAMLQGQKSMEKMPESAQACQRGPQEVSAHESDRLTEPLVDICTISEAKDLSGGLESCENTSI